MPTSKFTSEILNILAKANRDEGYTEYADQLDSWAVVEEAGEAADE